MADTEKAPKKNKKGQIKIEAGDLKVTLKVPKAIRKGLKSLGITVG